MSRPSARTAILAGVLLAACACADSSSGPCSGNDCGGHGVCVAVGDTTYCWCAAGFHPVGMVCAANDSTDPCRDVLCWGHGVCRVTLDDLPVCDCEPGYDVYYDLYCLPHVEGDAETDGGDGEAEGEAGETDDVPDLTYDWQTGAWGDCSAPCGGGTQLRSVTCVRSDGETADDALCTATRPADRRACNTDPCCSTDALVQNRRCDGDERVQWVEFGSNTGSVDDRARCADQCTGWAAGEGLSGWCCQLYEDSSAGTNWVCRVYDAPTDHASTNADAFAGPGRCL